jgi:hypothetical protein
MVGHPCFALPLGPPVTFAAEPGFERAGALELGRVLALRRSRPINIGFSAPPVQNKLRGQQMVIAELPSPAAVAVRASLFHVTFRPSNVPPYQITTA